MKRQEIKITGEHKSFLYYDVLASKLLTTWFYQRLLLRSQPELGLKLHIQ